jgi:hypothetical protein
MEQGKWLLCPVCNNKTRIKLRADTLLENFPLFCPKVTYPPFTSKMQTGNANQCTTTKFINY